MQNLQQNIVHKKIILDNQDVLLYTVSIVNKEGIHNV